ncbi:MAG: LacI family DNA-binding transcriptional regulator [Luteolibacter sp.]|uniref:LacI family DNA-binding transcriptional regulator n=1 Tax=Luteolibacter sp. TaxID=1962973 RepID=UPI003265FCC2
MNSDSTPPRVNLRDIAAKLGVSHSTVSLSLRDHPRISAAVKSRVREAAEAMGYRPDPMLAALANYRLGKDKNSVSAGIAWINAWQKPHDLRKFKEFDFYWNGAFKAAEKFGYRLEEFQLNGDLSPKRLHQILSTRGIRGILLPPHQPPYPDWKDFPWSEYSIVRFGRSLLEPACHIVTADQISNTMLAVQKIHERGYQRIGYVATEGEFSKRGVQFELGFFGGQRLIRDPNPIPVLIQREASSSDPKPALKTWLKKYKPDAIFTPDPKIPALLAELGYEIPGDMGLAATSILDGKLDSGIDQHPEEIGRVGFLMLNSLINDRARGIPPIFRQILVEGSWVDGKSLPDLR